MSSRRLTAALAHSRQLNARHGKSFYLATKLLPAASRPHVHALYGFARHADDLVDEPGPHEPAAALDDLELALKSALAGQIDNAHPVVLAVAHAAQALNLDPQLFHDFLTAMRTDLTVTEYATLADLETYMHGSAEVFGHMMLPILGAQPGAEASAAALGRAFQLTNFLRDVGEDLARDRVYLPQDLLTTCGVDHDLLEWSRTRKASDRRITNALSILTAHARAEYRVAATGIPLLSPPAQRCIHAAAALYSAILTQIEAEDYPVLHRRVTIRWPTKLRLISYFSLSWEASHDKEK